MIECKNCKGKNIKSRTNYPHGKKSKGVTTRTCKGCGSTNIEVTSDRRKKR